MDESVENKPIATVVTQWAPTVVDRSKETEPYEPKGWQPGQIIKGEDGTERTYKLVIDWYIVPWEVIAGYMEFKGIGLKALRDAGVNDVTIKRLRGHREVDRGITIGTLNKLAKGLQVPALSLVYGERHWVKVTGKGDSVRKGEELWSSLTIGKRPNRRLNDTV